MWYKKHAETHRKLADIFLFAVYFGSYSNNNSPKEQKNVGLFCLGL